MYQNPEQRSMPSDYSQPQPIYPVPPQGYPPQPQVPAGYPGYPPPVGAPYPQQPYPYPPNYPMPPIIINNTATANANGGIMTRPQHPSFIIRLIWFCCIGCWAGTIWGLVALFLCCTVIGLPLGIVMLARMGKVFFL